jgi:hypothetical protein
MIMPAEPEERQRPNAARTKKERNKSLLSELFDHRAGTSVEMSARAGGRT